MDFRPFKAGHLMFMTPQPEQRAEHAALLRSQAVVELEQGVALSGWVDGKCVGAAGLIHVTEYRAVAWAILSSGIGAGMLPVVRKVRRVMSASPYRRIEMTVASDFEDGIRFAKLIGARLETPEPMRFYGAGGRDEYMYAVVRET